MTPPFSRILVANRGEIAIRVFRACRELGVETVAVYSEADAGAPHVRYADEAVLLGAAAPSESYLNIPKLIDAAKRTGAQAIHPGYGFLAESAPFATAVEEAGLVWIGPPPSAIDAMGSKINSRILMADAGVPIVPGTTEEITDPVRVVELGEQYGWPIALKASAGGGGRGLKVVHEASEAERLLEAAKREGEAWFGNGAVYVEKYVEDPRHVEIQVMADMHGTTVHLGERDCTLQRRHQKIVEESPSPAVNEELRARMGAMAVAAAEAVGYVGAGTVECLLDRHGDFFFLEMNTRIQVEHPVTELVTGVDLVREQILVASGQPLSFAQSDIVMRGHAIECRVNAEDPANGFTPSPGKLLRHRLPSGPGIRVESGVEEGGEINDRYDPMVAKLLVWDTSRERAIARMRRALDEYEIVGPKTLLPMHRIVMRAPEFAAGETCAGLVEGAWADACAALADESTAAPAQSASGTTIPRHVPVEVDGRRYDVVLRLPAAAGAKEARNRIRARQSGGVGGASEGSIVSPMQGTVLQLEVAEGDHVEAGQVVAVVEAMKMENEVTSLRDGTVEMVHVQAGQGVQAGQVLLELAGD
ncbi:MAG: acetyl-CoA carboxylase biotin carboxylase subunit [Thermoleophilia bacterium]|nr:acetyl-CoA carboxylase biotin carboxylase subunit [Thermoleophilia bacterium]